MVSDGVTTNTATVGAAGADAASLTLMNDAASESAASTATVTVAAGDWGGADDAAAAAAKGADDLSAAGASGATILDAKESTAAAAATATSAASTGEEQGQAVVGAQPLKSTSLILEYQVLSFWDNNVGATVDEAFADDCYYELDDSLAKGDEQRQSDGAAGAADKDGNDSSGAAAKRWVAVARHLPVRGSFKVDNLSADTKYQFRLRAMPPSPAKAHRRMMQCGGGRGRGGGGATSSEKLEEVDVVEEEELQELKQQQLATAA